MFTNPYSLAIVKRSVPNGKILALICRYDGLKQVYQVCTELITSDGDNIVFMYYDVVETIERTPSRESFKAALDAFRSHAVAVPD